MTKEEIIKGNKLIAEFMEWDKYKNGIYYTPFDNASFCNGEPTHIVNFAQDLRFHSSWDWLMPVVEKIELECRCDVHIYAHYNWKESNRCSIVTWKNDEIVQTSNDSKIQCVYNAIIYFIKWYNENKT